MIKVYLDNCCYNRPFDSQIHPQVILETTAKIQIQNLIKKEELQLVTSYALFMEINQSPFVQNAKLILDYIKKNTFQYISTEDEEEIILLRDKIMLSGIKKFDATHIACAIFSECDYFITTDYRLLKYKTDDIVIINPYEFLEVYRNE
jgi:predicted nucleic acid-binding protein